MTLTQERNDRPVSQGNEAADQEADQEAGQETEQDKGQETPLASAGGNHRQQLKHFKHHKAFQSQDRAGRMKINWNTTITREQSRRHITKPTEQPVWRKPDCGRSGAPAFFANCTAPTAKVPMR